MTNGRQMKNASRSAFLSSGVIFRLRNGKPNMSVSTSYPSGILSLSQFTI